LDLRPEREKVVGGCRRLRNEELHNLYGSPNIISMIKSRKLRWVGQVARMGEVKKYTKFGLENPKVRDHLGKLGVNETIINVL
jgi:hypothetical protein